MSKWIHQSGKKYDHSQFVFEIENQRGMSIHADYFMAVTYIPKDKALELARWIQEQYIKEI